jgi:hypothetical protein
LPPDLINLFEPHDPLEFGTYFIVRSSFEMRALASTFAWRSRTWVVQRVHPIQLSLGFINNEVFADEICLGAHGTTRLDRVGDTLSISLRPDRVQLEVGSSCVNSWNWPQSVPQCHPKCDRQIPCTAPVSAVAALWIIFKAHIVSYACNLDLSRLLE